MARYGGGILYLITGFGLSMGSRAVEQFGDVAPEGSFERLGYHLLALMLLVLAIGLFVRGGVSAIRAITGYKSKAARDLIRTFADEPGGPSAFDPDAALARYQKAKAAGALSDETSDPVHPAGSGFGRKGV